MTTTYRIERDPQVCDFCTDPFPVTAYQCADFIWAKDSPLPHQSEAAWSACRVCSALIDGGHWASLTDRAFEHFLRKHHVPFIDQPGLRRAMVELHDLFRQHMLRAA
jgi:hypothetical protein